MLVSTLAPAGTSPQALDARQSCRQSVITDPGTRRIAFVMFVGTLTENLHRLDAAHVRIEPTYNH